MLRELVEAKSVTLEPVDIRLKDRDFDILVKNRLMGTSLSQGDKISVNFLGISIPFIVKKTEPEGLVTIGKNTDLQVLSMPEEYKVVQKMKPRLAIPKIEAVGLLTNILKEYEKRFDAILLQLEIIRKKLEDHDKKFEKLTRKKKSLSIS